MEKFVNFREVLTPSGVYLLLHGGRVVYVGKSKNLFHRLYRHYVNQVRARKGLDGYGNKAGPVVQFDDVEVKFCAVDELDKEEVRLIQQHLPIHNIHHVVPRHDMRHIPAFQELLKRARASSRSVPNYLRRGF